MRVCLACGMIDYRRALEAIPPDVIDGWMAFDALTGAITGTDQDHRAATAAAVLMNCWSDSQTPAVTPADILPLMTEESRRQAIRTMQDRLQESEEERIEREIRRIPRHPNA